MKFVFFMMINLARKQKKGKKPHKIIKKAKNMTRRLIIQFVLESLQLTSPSEIT